MAKRQDRRDVKHSKQQKFLPGQLELFDSSRQKDIIENEKNPDRKLMLTSISGHKFDPKYDLFPDEKTKK